MSSFATIGALWLAHSVATEFLARVNALLIRLNLLLLMVVSFIPFPTGLLAEYGADEDAGNVATTIYGITLLLAATLLSVLWRYALGARLVKADARDEDIKMLTARLTPGLAGYVAMIVLGVFFPIVAVVGYLLIALFFLVPFGLIRRHAS